MQYAVAIISVHIYRLLSIFSFKTTEWMDPEEETKMNEALITEHENDDNEDRKEDSFTSNSVTGSRGSTDLDGAILELSSDDHLLEDKDDKDSGYLKPIALNA